MEEEVVVAGPKETVAIPIGLRGSLAQRFQSMQDADPEQASEWVRKLASDAVDNHPQLQAYMQENLETKQRRLIVGLKSELGKYPPDW